MGTGSLTTLQPEFQGGWIPGIDTKGFDSCQALFDSEFQRVFYHSNIAQGELHQSAVR